MAGIRHPGRCQRCVPRRPCRRCDRCRAAVRLFAADPEVERLNTLALVLWPPPQSAGPTGKPL
eukprot:4140891-Prymnesium_polylepis.1